MTISSVIITAGEPAGIGPDIIVSLAEKNHDVEWVALGPKSVFSERAKLLDSSLEIIDWTPSDKPVAQKAGTLKVWDHPLTTPVSPGVANTDNVPVLIEGLKKAVDNCRNGRFNALVTAPINKAVVNEAGVAFTGHTEFFRDYSDVDDTVMMLACPEFRVALATTHVPLRQVPDLITKETLTRRLKITHTALSQQLNRKPTIAVCGLNPHAGENGHLGFEEEEIILPVIETLNSQGCHLLGPVAADTAFTPSSLTQCDLVFALYHDQGLPVLKHQGFGEAVNVTLGLPFIRTSVDHGTAFSLAGTGLASAKSLETALSMAHTLANNSSSGAR